MKDLKTLVANSIAVHDGMVAHYPQFDRDEELFPSSILSKFNGRVYAMNNSTTAYICDAKFYVTPICAEVMDILEAEGFKREDFFVPFSNWDYPKDAKERWDQLRKQADRSYDRRHQQECEAWCDEHHIGTIANIEKRCFRMPDFMQVRYLQGYEGFHSALCARGKGNYTEFLGTFCRNNGIVAINYRDGVMYLTKGYKITKELFAAGYTETGFMVPLSNNETIINADLRARWEEIQKNV